MTDTFTLISLGLTVPFLILASIVCVLWGSSLKVSACQNFPPENRARQWFAFGVFIGFVGGIGDNSYWQIAWTLDYIESYLASTVFSYGVVSNIPFRQICGIISAYAHCRSVVEDSGIMSITLLNMITYISFILGFVYSLVLLIIKTMP